MSPVSAEGHVLGHDVREDGIDCDPDKVAVIASWLRSTNVLRSSGILSVVWPPIIEHSYRISRKWHVLCTILRGNMHYSGGQMSARQHLTTSPVYSSAVRCGKFHAGRGCIRS